MTARKGSDKLEKEETKEEKSMSISTYTNEEKKALVEDIKPVGWA